MQVEFPLTEAKKSGILSKVKKIGGMRLDLQLTPIAKIENDFCEKFSIPRQSGLCDVVSRIVFFSAYRDENALRGIEDYSHLWLIWGFSEVEKKPWSPTVRPPRLGGNARMGVFATRSPYRPNPLGLSSVKLLRVEYDKTEGPVLYVSGADLKDQTPIYDIKPYLSYTDSHPDAVGGFADAVMGDPLSVTFSPDAKEKLSQDQMHTLAQLLAQDPRPRYQNDPLRVYTFAFAKKEISFTVSDSVVSVIGVR